MSGLGIGKLHQWRFTLQHCSSRHSQLRACLTNVPCIHKEDQAAAGTGGSGGGSGGALQYVKINSLVAALEKCSQGVPGGLLQALSDTVCNVIHLPPPPCRLTAD